MRFIARPDKAASDNQGLSWFNVSSRPFWVGRNTETGKEGVFVRWFNLFYRRSKSDGDSWGIGILQLGSRHLLYVGSAGLYVAFIGRTS